VRFITVTMHSLWLNYPMVIAVIGIGQSLRGDDEVGLAAVRTWMDTFGLPDQGVRVELAESPGMGLLDLMQGAASAVLVDAVKSGANPGTLHLLQESDLGAFHGDAGSAHGWGVAETLALGRRVTPESLPGRVILIGIEIAQAGVGDGLSPEVAAALPLAAGMIQDTIAWLSDVM
jgi:hydrogenase maturation protease